MGEILTAVVFENTPTTFASDLPTCRWTQSEEEEDLNLVLATIDCKLWKTGISVPLFVRHSCTL